MKNSVNIILASLLLCVFALNGCTSTPVKPVGQAVSSQPLASIMPPAVTLNPGKVLPVWNPPAQPTTVTISRQPSKGVFVLVAATNIALPLSQWQPAYIGFSNSVTLEKQWPVEFFRGI